ncbi:MAG: hypothetical protein ACI3XQ_12170 [Eubacteriales bacterium]
MYIIGNYGFDRMYMCDEELLMLRKIQELVKNKLNEKGNAMPSQIIKIISKSPDLFLMLTVVVNVNFYNTVTVRLNLKEKEK